MKWLADFSDGDARIALNSLNLAMESVVNDSTDTEHELKLVSLDAIRDGIKVLLIQSISTELDLNYLHVFCFDI